MTSELISVYASPILRDILQEIAAKEKRSVSAQIVYFLEREQSVAVELMKRGE